MFGFAQVIILIFATFFSGSSIADTNICIENGTKVIRSGPCKGGVTPKATYRAIVTKRLLPAAKTYVQPNRISERKNPQTMPPMSIDSQEDGYSQKDGYSQEGNDFNQPFNQPAIIQPMNTNGSSTTGQHGGMVTGGSLSGSILPGSQGGMVVGGPLNGSILPGSQGGMVIGGPVSGTIWPGSEGGMIHGGPLSGSIIPSDEGGMIIGGPFSGTILPPRQ